MKPALKRFLRARPGVKFFLIGLGVAGLGVLAVEELSKPLGAILLVIGLALMIGFRYDSDLRRGWPPWPLSAFSSSARARDEVISEQSEAEMRRLPGLSLASMLVLIAGSIALLVWAALDWSGYRSDQPIISAIFGLIGAAAVIIVGPLRVVWLARLLRAKRAGNASALSRNARRPVG